MTSKPLSRRHFITSSGIVFTLPWLEAFLPDAKLWAATAAPRRFVCLYMPNGTYNLAKDAPWHPATGALTTNLPLVLSPFANQRGDFSILKGIRSSAYNATQNRSASMFNNNIGHAGAIVTYLTGQLVTMDPASTKCAVPGDSFDQIIGKKTGKSPLVMHTGAGTGAGDRVKFRYGNYVSYKDSREVEPNKNPVTLFQRMFSNLVLAPKALAATAASTSPVPMNSVADRKRSILDSAVSDIRDLKAKLGKEDNIKLDDYFTSLRSLETRLFPEQSPSPTPSPTPGPMPGPTPSPGPNPSPSPSPSPTPSPTPGGNPTGGQCGPAQAPPSNLDNSDIDGVKPDFIQKAKAFMDMIVLAFQCDLVRSAVLMYDGENSSRIYGSQIPSNLVYGGVQLTAGNHFGISHYSTNTNGREKCITRDRLYMMLNCYLIDKLKSAKDFNGSPILDNTIVMSGFSVQDGAHQGGSAGIPLMVGGGRNFIHPGNCYDVSSYDLKDLLYTFSTHLGLGLSDFVGNKKIMNI